MSTMNRRAFLKFTGVVALCACTREQPAPAVLDAGAPQAAPAAQATTRLQVDVWHDMSCPWCRIGLHNLGQVLSAWSGPPVTLLLHPFLLEPGAPAEGTDLRAMLTAKYGNVSVDQIFSRVTQMGTQYGVRFNWEKVRVSPQTAAAHALLAAAPLERQRALLESLHRAYFEQGLNIGDVQVLASASEEAGLTAEFARSIATDPKRLSDVRAQAAWASSSGVRGVPYFQIGGQTLQGARSPDELRAALQVLARR
ncbi:DsbA family oxidoreductase [Hyalangium rubrum]|uniref:DsbA family oxidoreductase n=1 Tax=Hyalangium rubrum TaxID=3103134 RepID=A0ABU5H5Z7_9BACT|nr:DsbA family oxidoreductase [Hyalangium sp. s54d21]MDY7228902.1 DsbA family oxidoreductase [Hyalangium sp. s54d21]